MIAKHRSRRHLLGLRTILCCWLTSPLACSERPRPPAQTVEAEEDAPPYPLGRWRLAPIAEVNSVVLWISQIAIQHAESEPQHTRLRVLGWSPDPPKPKRSKQEAFALAKSIAARARRNPDSFAALARAHSEDVVTRDRDGSMGGVRAGELPPAFVDALEHMAPGAVSRVVETPFGYHVLQRRKPPERAEVAGRRILIHYATTLVYGATDAADFKRTRAAAFEYARTIVQEARHDPTKFVALVQRHTEDEDRVRDGDLGVWSTWDPEFEPDVVEALSQLQVGEISAPVDTRLGWQIFQRTEVTPREPVTFTAVRLNFDRDAPATASNSRAAQERAAQAIAAKVRRDPARFAELQAAGCCKEILSFVHGHEPPTLSEALRGLAVGEVASRAFASGLEFYLPRRLAMSDAPAKRPVRYELPTPDAVDVVALVRRADPAQLAALQRQLTRDAQAALKLPAAQAAALDAINERIAADYEHATSPDARATALEAGMRELEAALGERETNYYVAFARRWSTERFLAAQQ